MVKLMYLAHPYDSMDKVRKWELEFEKKSGIELINPFFDVKRNDIENKRKGKDRFKYLDAKEIVHRDVAQIARAEGIIAIVDGQVSYGTIMEICYAKM